MIQRKQTFWLLVALICAALTFWLPFYNGTLKPNASGVHGAELTATDNIGLMLLAGATAVIAGFAIFLFKNRSKQFWVSFLGFLLSIGLPVLFYHYTKAFQTGGLALSSLVTLAAIISFFFALKGIRKDQKLIRDLNRLR
jgi:uncharacterized membrane protein HdeD (DUF308 family)